MPRLPLLWSWLHACLAIQSDLGHISLVINGEQVLENLVLSQDQKISRPSSLFGKLVLGKTQIDPNVWIQNRMHVTNLNVYSGVLTTSRMKMITFGEECGKAEGDVLAWTRSEWRLGGVATWRDVEGPLCEKEEQILFFDKNLPKMTDCRELCPKLQEEGRMPSIATEEKLEKVVSKMRENLIDILWAPVAKSSNSSQWIDIYSGEPIEDSAIWWPGFPDENPQAKCAILNDKVKNWECEVSGGRGGRFCACHFPKRPFLLLRGLCKDSHLDQLYLPRNERVQRTITYYGTVRSTAMFNGTFWQMKTAFFKTTAVSDAPDASFMLGKYNWTVKGDSAKCAKGNVYTKELKLTGCKEEQFTCDDGQCIAMEERCNQVSDNCKVLLFLFFFCL